MKGTYEILEYIAITSNGNENRQMIVYYSNEGKEETRELYYSGYVIQRGYAERSSVISDQQDEE